METPDQAGGVPAPDTTPPTEPGEGQGGDPAPLEDQSGQDPAEDQTEAGQDDPHREETAAERAEREKRES